MIIEINGDSKEIDVKNALIRLSIRAIQGLTFYSAYKVCNITGANMSDKVNRKFAKFATKTGWNLFGAAYGYFAQKFVLMAISGSLSEVIKSLEQKNGNVFFSKEFVDWLENRKNKNEEEEDV